MKTNKNLHLALSVLIIIPVALAYGFYPEKFVPKLFYSDTGIAAAFRVLMGLYLLMAAFWITGIWKQQYWYAATISNIIFMGALATGRLISLFVNGIPTIYFSIGLIVELLLAVWGIINIKKYGSV